MWPYIKKYLHFAILAAVLMAGEVCADLLQPSLMMKIVDDGVLGLAGGDLTGLNTILSLGALMIGTTILGGLCGSANNVFCNLCVQNIGNLLRIDAFQKILSMTLSQTERFGTGSLITRVTNDITRVERYVEVFIRGVIRTGITMLGSIIFMFQLNQLFGFMTLVAFPIAVILIFCLP